MHLSNDIVLRPRFQMELGQPCSEVVGRFMGAKTAQNRYTVSCVDTHVFIKLPRNEQHFWSPQLHLEMIAKTENSCMVHGFFGPNPTMWTMFIFFHVAVGSLFLVNAIWGYSNYNLEQPFKLQIGIAIFLMLLWILLYIVGRIGKRKGKSGMWELYDFMGETVG